MKKVVLTGGGSTGHVALNKMLIPIFIKDGWEVSYIGSSKGIERKIIEEIPEVKYYPISTGKFRRYFSLKNFTDVPKILFGTIQAYIYLKKNKPDLVFSKGGFVSVPVVYAASFNKITIYSHESDMSLGLANRLTYKKVKKIFTVFPMKVENSKCVGSIRNDTLPVIDNPYSDMDLEKDNLLVLGGSLGAASINNVISKNLDTLLSKYNIVHLTGENYEGIEERENYLALKYVNYGLEPLVACADIVVSRAGSNSIFEILNQSKINLLIPLPKESSRGDQILNANYFKEKGYSEVLEDDKLDINNLTTKLEKLKKNKMKYIGKMKEQKELININEFYELLIRDYTDSKE